MPSSLRSIIEEKPTTSAARIAARRRVVILERVPSSCVNTPLLLKRAMTEPPDDDEVHAASRDRDMKSADTYATIPNASRLPYCGLRAAVCGPNAA